MKKVGDEKLTARWFWTKSQQKHSQRVREIREKISTRIGNSLPKPGRNTQASNKFHDNERRTEIHRDNIKLLGNLTDISHGRRSCSTSIILDSVKNLPKPKSLNLQARKQEAQRIISDNEAIATRLLHSSKGLSFKKLDQEWHNAVKYKKTISKAKFRVLPRLNEKISTAEAIKLNDSRSSAQQRRSNSMHEPQTVNLHKREHINNFSLSPVLQNNNPEVVLIEGHKPTADFMVKGSNKCSTTRPKQKSRPTKLDPLKTFSST